MTQQEYLKNRFKRDFLHYSLLQEDSFPAKEIAEKLYGVIDLNWLIGQGKQEIESLCNKHLSFEKVKVEGKLSVLDFGKQLDSIDKQGFKECLPDISLVTEKFSLDVL